MGQNRTGNLTLWSGLSTYCSGCFADLWDVTVAASDTVTVSMGSGQLDPYLKVLRWNGTQFQPGGADDNSGGGTTARLTLQGGTFRIEATTARPGIGSYSLSLQPAVPPMTPITLGQTVSGTLTSTDGRSVGCGGCYADVYEFTIGQVPLPPNEFYAIILRSGSFNAVLRILNTNGQIVAMDDNGFGGTDALIDGRRISLPPGTFRIEVTTATPGTGGAYTLEFRRVVIGAPGINVGQTVNGSLDVLDAFSQSCGSCYVDYWDFTITSPQTLTISMNSAAFDAYLRVTYGATLSDDNSGGGTNSRITYMFPVGSYRIEATSARPGALGAYTLTLRPAGQPSVAGRWGTVFIWTLSNCPIPREYCTVCTINHAYSISQSGNNIQGTSLDSQSAQISGTITGNSLSLLLKESFPGGCTRTHTLTGTLAGGTIDGTSSGGDDNCGTCRINGTFTATVAP